MRLPVILMLILAAGIICLPAAGIPVPHGINITGGVTPAPVGITIAANPAGAHVGDTIILNGTVTGVNTIAVYLFVTGPDLDPRGVALENLNIAAGRGLFTTAPVRMSDGTWTYTWDTSIITGNLKPGNYSVYVVASPLDRLRSNPQETAVTGVSFAPSEDPEVDTPVSPVVPVCALFCAVVIFSLAGLRRK